MSWGLTFNFKNVIVNVVVVNAITITKFIRKGGMMSDHLVLY